MKEHVYYDFFHHSPQAFSYHRVIIDDQGLPCDYDFLDVNNAFEQLTGIPATDVIHHRYTELFPSLDGDIPGWFDAFREAAIYRRTVTASRYHRGLKKWLTLTTYGVDDMHFACFYTLSTAVEAPINPIPKIAFYEILDQLKGVISKSLFDQRAEAEANRSDRYGEPLSLLLMEIEIKNDEGTQSSTLVLDRLKQTVSIFLSLVRKYDVLTRETGLRFMLLMPKTNEEGAQIVIDRIRHSLRSPLSETLNVTFSYALRQPNEPIADWYRRTEKGIYSNEK